MTVQAAYIIVWWFSGLVLLVVWCGQSCLEGLLETIWSSSALAHRPWKSIREAIRCSVCRWAFRSLHLGASVPVPTEPCPARRLTARNTHLRDQLRAARVAMTICNSQVEAALSPEGGKGRTIVRNHRAAVGGFTPSTAAVLFVGCFQMEMTSQDSTRR